MNTKQIISALNLEIPDWLTLIALEGGPCGGKSTFYKRAKKHLEDHGYSVAVTPEVATQLISGGIEPWNPNWASSADFQIHVLTSGLIQESLFINMLDGMRSDKSCVLFCDRGVVGGAAYTDDAAFRNILEGFSLDFSTLLHRYGMVIHLVTAAEGAEEFYTLDNNGARTETPDQARTLDRRTVEVYQNHPFHRIIGNETDFPKKINRALVALSRKLKIPMAQEIEKKWWINNFNPEVLPQEGVTKIDIVQTYLHSEDEEVERRVRCKQVQGDNPVYVYTEKRPTENPAVREEDERVVPEEEYDYLLKEIKPGTHTIHKTRYKIQHGSYWLELDVYHRRLDGLTTVEIEVATEDELMSLGLPVYLQSFNPTDVTTDEDFSNAQLARVGAW